MAKPGPPRLGISGFHHSGKTRLIEQLIGALGPQGMRVAVIKHLHEPLPDRTGPGDTNRLYRAGATVLGYDGLGVFTLQPAEEPFSIETGLEILGLQFDLVLIEGFKNSDFDKIWLLRPDETEPPKSISNIIKVLPWSQDRLQQALPVVRAWLANRQFSFDK